MDNIQLCYIDNEINKIDKMKQGDVIYKNGMELLVVLSETPTRYIDQYCINWLLTRTGITCIAT